MELLLQLSLGVCFSALTVSSFSDSEPPKVENVHWVSLDFKTILRWSATPSDYTFTVTLSEDGSDWNTTPDCIQISETECDLTHELLHKDRSFQAYVQTEGGLDDDYDPEELPHAYSPPFNPYKQNEEEDSRCCAAGELSAVAFSIQRVAERSVTLNISDPLTGIHDRGKQLSIRDVLKKDLKYKVSYYKAGSTGKRDQIVDSNMAPIPNLDPGQSYCFMVAAFLPSRPKPLQQGAWSTQTCTSGSGILDELDLRTVFQAIFIPLVLLIVLVTVLVIYCRFCRRKHKNPDPQPQVHAPAQCSVV